LFGWQGFDPFPLMEQSGKISALPFDTSACPRATVDDISEEKLGMFLGTAQRERN
jgi:hypothetical protein